MPPDSPRRYGQRRSGFTLLEAAVAMSIMGIVSIGVLSAFGAELRAVARAQQMLPAGALAKERLEVLELLDGHTIRTLPDSTARGAFPKPFESYAWQVTTKEVRGEPALVEIVVRVSWADGAYELSERRYRPASPITLNVP